MTSIGLLCVTMLTSLLLAILDMTVYHESLGTALYRQSWGAGENWKTYLFIAAAFLLASIEDIRKSKPTRIRKKMNGPERTTDGRRNKL